MIVVGVAPNRKHGYLMLTLAAEVSDVYPDWTDIGVRVQLTPETPTVRVRDLVDPETLEWRAKDPTVTPVTLFAWIGTLPYDHPELLEAV